MHVCNNQFSISYFLVDKAYRGFKFAEMTMSENCLPTSSIDTYSNIITESVWFAFVKKFIFSPLNKKIDWKVGVAEAPTVEGVHALPLTLSPVKTYEDQN